MRVVLAQRAQRFCSSLPTKERERIMQRLMRLALDPVPSDAKFFAMHDGDRLFRYRVGPYRVIYTFQGDVVLVVNIGKRENVYD